MISIKGCKVSRPLRLLTKNEIYKLHLASIEVLEKTGVVFYDDKALEILKNAGSEVDIGRRIVKIPQHLVNWAISSSPRSVRLCGRKPEYDIKIGGEYVFFGAGANALYVLDYGAIDVRRATIKDLEKLTKLADGLENISFYLALVSPHDVPQEIVDRAKCNVVLKNTVKHFFHDAQGSEGALDQIRMASAIVGGEEELRKRPLISLAPCISSPLRWSREALGVLMTMARNGLPQIISSEPLSGVTSPVTLAGSIVQQNAEILSGLVLAQLIRKGTPVITCTLPSIMDQRVGNISMGSIELGLMSAAMAQLMQTQYRLPYAGTGCVSDSKIADEQAAYEKALTCLLPSQAGANMIHLATGMLEAILTVSFEQVVIDNEIIGMVIRAIKGIEVSDETIAESVIHNAGPGGNFLKQKHTVAHLRKEHFFPEITSRETRSKWKTEGCRDILKAAKEKVDKIMKIHQPTPLEKDIQRELDRILREAYQRRQISLA